MGDLKWNGDIILLLHSNKKDYWFLELNKKTIDFHFERAEKGDPHGQYDLGIMYLYGNNFLAKDEKKAFYWLNKSAENGYVRALKYISSK
ncbi:SEL1-like repeat protein [Salmonella enterica subsp. enterica]|nr:SEL1-like repeat protein [Salmonella enterica subsp. enterica]